MNWSFLTRSEATGTPGRSRIFLYLGLTVLFLLVSYQLVLNRELLGSVADWATETAGLSSFGSSFDSSSNITDSEIKHENETLISTGINHNDTHPVTASDNVNVTTPSSTVNNSTEVASTKTSAIPTNTNQPLEKELVIAAMQKSDMSWVTDNLPQWYTNIYRADASPEEANLTVPANRGNEAMVYLTYIIDRYETLPNISLFIHSGRYQWHNDNPLYDTVISIQDLQPHFVAEAGYVNLRCTWAIGCPAELEPARYMRERPDDPGHATAVNFPDSFALLFPDIEMPEVVGVPCCSQFALSREKIRERPVKDYVRVRRWLMETHLDAGVSGRVLEYCWHIMFGKPAQFCLDARECFCKTYGYCNMTDDDLKNQWQWRGLSLPEGWPNVPEAPTGESRPEGEAETKPETKPEGESEGEPEAQSESQSKESTEQPESTENTGSIEEKQSRKRSLALADEVPDISDAARRALRDASV